MQPDSVIEEALKRDMSLLRDMGVNAIRQFADIPPKWIEWIYKNYGIYVVLNPLMGRYGIDVNGAFVANVDYSSPSQRKAILAQLSAAVERYRDTPGVLMWMLGNENNYGLAWTSFEIGNLPGSADDKRAVSLYSLFGEGIALIKARDTDHPVSLVNGDAAVYRSDRALLSRASISSAPTSIAARRRATSSTSSSRSSACR